MIHMNDYGIAVLKEATIIGLFTAAMGLFPTHNVNFIVLFIIGFLFQITTEISGFNRMYCKYGAACKKHRDIICQS